MLQDTGPDHAETSVRAICPRPGGGHVVTIGFPGLGADIRGRAVIDPERMDATLRHAGQAGVRLLLVLTQPDELPDGAMAMLRQGLKAQRLCGLSLPIEDYAVPSPAFLRAWTRLSPCFKEVFTRDGAVGMCCHHGAGRSGVVAAMHLIEAGYSAAEAVEMLRSQFPETVENERQYAWLRRYAAVPQNRKVSS